MTEGVVGRSHGGETEVQGHRGARGLWPENTLPGFARTIELGVDVLELDVGRTTDGVAVLHHDQVIDAGTIRDTEPAWPADPMFPYVGRAIRELSLAQIRMLDANVVNQRFKDTQQEIPGATVPTLAEVCEIAGDVTLAVEIKTDPSWSDADVKALTLTAAEVCAAHDVRYRLLGFDWRVLAVAREHVPGIPRVALAEESTLDRAWLGDGYEGDLAAAAHGAGATMLSPRRSLTDSALIERAHGFGLPVVVWTVNDQAEMRDLIKLGTDAIVTDFPDLLLAVTDRY
jgi:glycerophosphoryl diester phosphodiesterase